MDYKQITYNTRIIDVTIGELMEYIYSHPKPQEVETPKERRYLHSIKEIADFLNVSKTTVNQWKKKGIITGAIVQGGKGMSLMADADELLRLVNDYKNKTE